MKFARFQQTRFRGVRLLDETAILGCAAYVDLNPIRAAIAETLEDSDFTSAQKRIADLRAECLVGSDEQSEEMGCSRPNASSGRHLAPLFQRLGISADIWCQLLQDFGRLFSVVAGQPQKIDQHRLRSKTNAHRFRTRTETRELMQPA